jgi:hypothetical protein
MDAGTVDSGNIGAKAAPCLEASAYLSRLWRADERTRTADLLITSVRSAVAVRCRDVQITPKQRVSCSLHCPPLQGIACGSGSN